MPNDWETATRIFGLITRIDADGFLDGRTPEQPAATWHGAAMDVTTLSLLVRTALQALTADAGTSGPSAGAPPAAHPARPRSGERR